MRRYGVTTPLPGMSKAAVTGTREGATYQQLATFTRILLATGATSLGHGDCIGADKQAHGIARKLGLWITGYPPNDEKNRAWCECDEYAAPAPYLERNKLIVNQASFLIALPRFHYEETRSGTWAAVRYARTFGGNRPIFIIAPDGNTL